jgi:hypothetical protein
MLEAVAAAPRGLERGARSRGGEAESESGVYYESCVIPYDSFFELFDSLADPLCPHCDVLAELVSGVREEKLSIDPDRFGLLMSLTTARHSRQTQRAAYDLIWEYAQFPIDAFLEMAPPDFVELLYSNILSRRPFQIIEKLIRDAPNAINKLLELGVVELIVSKVDYHKHEFETALSLFECLMCYPIGKPGLYDVIPTLLAAAEKCQRSGPLCQYLICLRRVAGQDPAVQAMVAESSAFIGLFSRKVNHCSLRIAILKLLAVVADGANPFELLAQQSVLEFVMGSITSEDEAVLSATCFMLFLVAQMEPGRDFLMAQGVPAMFLRIIAECSFTLTNYLMWVLCEIALTSNIDIMNHLIGEGLVDALAMSLPSLDRMSVRVALDALLNIGRIAQATGREELMERFFGDEEIVTALRDLSESEDETIAECARSLFLLSQTEGS